MLDFLAIVQFQFQSGTLNDCTYESLFFLVLSGRFTPSNKNALQKTLSLSFRFGEDGKFCRGTCLHKKGFIKTVMEGLEAVDLALELV